MTSTRRGLLVVLALAPLGLWGCGQDRSANHSGKVRDLAARNARLEEEHRVATSASEGLRKKLAQTEARCAELKQIAEQLQEVTRERDELRKTLASRSSERDALHAQLTQFGKELQSLAGRVEAAACNRSSSPSVPTAVLATHE